MVSPSGEATWVRDALEGERLEAPYYPTHPVYGLTGPTGVTYHPGGYFLQFGLDGHLHLPVTRQSRSTPDSAV